MRARPAAVLLSLFLAFTLSADEWPEGYDAALARAKAEKKVLLVHFRSSCGICNRSTDRALIDAEKLGPITAMYDSFVRVRVNDGAIVGAIEGLVAQDPPAPSILVVDPSGKVVVVFKRVDPNAYLAILTSAAAETSNIVQLSELRAAGRRADAEHLLGVVLLHFNSLPEARDAFERAHAAYDGAHDLEHGELASIHADYVRCLMSDTEKNRGMSALLRATSSASKENAADAWICIGGIRNQEGDRGGAVRAFRKVLELMAPDSALARGARSQLEKLDDHPLADKGTAASVTIVKPSRASITGRAQFSARVNGNASRVEFLLDDVSVESVNAAPFETRIDLGNVPRVHTIKAIAYDATGKAIGEAVTTVNDRADAPRVSLVSPVAETVQGNVRIEADASVPPGRTLKSVELFWKEARLAHFEQPPFRVDFEAPKSFGYFRAVATLDDGTTAEDTHVVNAGDLAAEVDVHAIAFVATVVDRAGKGIRGIAPGEFVIRDEGKPVTATIRESPEEPVTIGLVIDASGSMTTSMLFIDEMTSQFLDVTMTPKDKVFIVAFESAPWLLHPLSNDVASLKKSVLGLRPGGTTAVVDGVAFGLQQFSGVTGKRALVVLTDGREGASTQTADAAIHLAKDSGIPVYGIITAGQTLGNPLVNIASATGGTMFFGLRRDDIIPMFEQIRDEVRGQYLISFVAADRGRPREWRRLTVEVPGREVKVRTVSGYFAR